MRVRTRLATFSLSLLAAAGAADGQTDYTPSGWTGQLTCLGPLPENVAVDAAESDVPEDAIREPLGAWSKCSSHLGRRTLNLGTLSGQHTDNQWTDGPLPNGAEAWIFRVGTCERLVRRSAERHL